ncbi:hypothetical protein MRX96_005632 [Rhipicephalus microplus]
MTATMEFDGALMKSGGFGRFQTILALVFLTTATAHFAFNHMSQVFILIVPEHYWCPIAVSEGPNSSFSDDYSWNGSVTSFRQTCRLELGIGAVDDNGTTTEQCPGGWYYEYGDLWKQYVLHTTFWIGSMAGYVTSGFLADRFGRRVAIGCLSAVSAVANLMPLVISQHWGLAVARLIAGLGAESVCSTIFVLVIEFTIPERRTLIGFVAGGGLVVTNSALSVAILIILWFVPESPSWHLTAGRRDEAIRTLTKIARVNGRREITKDDFKTLQIKTAEVTQMEQKRSFWKDTFALVATPRLRRNTLVLFGGWFLICLVYNANTLELSHLGLNVYGTYSTAIAFELPVNLFTILALDRLGRRWPNVGFMFIGGTISLVMALLRTDSSAATLVMAVLSIVCYAGGYNITYQLASEIFPTEIRGRGVLIKRLFGDIGSCLGADVAYLVEYDRYLPLLVMGVLSLLAALLLFFVPDTVHEPLPQTIEDGEQFAKDQGLCFCPVLVKRLPDRQDKEMGDKSNGEPIKGQEIVTHL